MKVHGIKKKVKKIKKKKEKKGEKNQEEEEEEFHFGKQVHKHSLYKCSL